MTIANFPFGCRIALTEKAIKMLFPFPNSIPHRARIMRGVVIGYDKFMDADTVLIKWDESGWPKSLHPSHLYQVPSGLEKVSVRHRSRRGGRVQEGLDYEWEEWQVVSGRRVISRHDSEDLALKAAHKRLQELESRGD